MGSRDEFIMSHFGCWLKITPEVQETVRLMNESTKKLLQFMDEIKKNLDVVDDAGMCPQCIRLGHVCRKCKRKGNGNNG